MKATWKATKNPSTGKEKEGKLYESSFFYILIIIQTHPLALAYHLLRK